MSAVSDFMVDVRKVYATGQATEHSYRPALQTLLSSLAEGITPINEPKRIKCGAPDFILQRGDVAIGHLEAKDINLDSRRCP